MIRSISVAVFLILFCVTILQYGCSSNSSAVTGNVSSGSNSWSQDSAGALPYRLAAEAVAIGQKMFVFGGTVEGGGIEQWIAIFDADSDHWEANKKFWEVPKSAFTASVVNGKVYLIGGFYYGGVQDTASPTVFDPATGSIDKLPTTGHYIRRQNQTAAVLNNKIYLIGGMSRDSNGYLQTMQVLDVATRQWSEPLPGPATGPRLNGFACVIGGKIYVYGSLFFNNATDSWDGSTVLDVYDPATNTWSNPVTTGNPTARSAFTASVVNNKIYVIGGEGSGKNNFISTVDVFDPATNTWSTPKTTGTFSERAGLASAVINGKIYTVGGGNDAITDDRFNRYFEVFQP